MYRRVVITGIGIISSIGNGISESLKSIRSLKSGIGPLTILNTIHKHSFPCGEIKLTDEELVVIAGKGVPDVVTRTTLLGIIAAKEAFNDAGIGPGEKPSVKTGIVSATTVGGMDKTEQYYFDFLNSGRYLEYVHTHDCCDNTQTIAECLGINDFMTTISTACSSSANAIMFGARLIRHGIADRIIAGGTDALSKFTLNGFNTLKILDEKLCRPFSNDRLGLNLGEGAGFIVLEADELPLKENRKIYCEITGYANANDAYHQTASSPDGYGPYLAMKNALDMSGFKPGQIDYINAHGTGTDNNDLTEGLAIEKIFSPRIPKVSSTKAFTGHTLGAAGAIEAVFSILAVKHGLIIPNLNYSGRINELSFEPATEFNEGLDIRSVLSNSFGFGGNDSSLIFSKY
ncbi:MAG: beta-ketoacyl-[acyl-carrier-protein] synthase family protein [Bacteroidetes bacterium]|nr:beta-ketoacyl-[acyl-carrier-protein] synthase family protein [Bacteroidota bacterium]